MIASGVLIFVDDTRNMSIAAQMSQAYRYSLPEWESRNIGAKWFFKLGLLAPWNGDKADKKRMISYYFSLAEQEEALVGKIAKNFESQLSGENLAMVEEKAKLSEKRLSKRDLVEELLESQIATKIHEIGLGPRNSLQLLGFHFPPIDLRLDLPPKILVVSPRDEIRMIEGILLEPDITLREATELEDSLLELEDLSVIVDETAGIASYPSVVSSYKTLRETLRIASHEWLHHYLFFRPLGQAYWNDPFITSLNETVASMFGTEIGDDVYYQLALDENETIFREIEVSSKERSKFEYRHEMWQTRMRVEELLELGKVIEAEEYMETRRQFFSDNGYFIRKLNQAYFAFHGNYGDSAASISQLHNQLIRIRENTSIGEFVRILSKVSTEDQFMDLLEKRT